MTSFKYGCVNKYERFYDKLFSISLNQIDENNHQKSSLQLNNNLLNMGKLHKIVVPSISIDVQPNMIIDYQRVSKKVPMSKKSRILSKIVALIF